MTVEQQLAERGSYMTVTRGGSMRPLFRTGRDAVVIETPKGPIRRFDVVLYRAGDRYVLHRVLREYENFFFIKGDNTFIAERVPKENVLGVMTSFVRKGKKTAVSDRSYRLYIRLWWAIYPVRHVLWLLRRLCGSLYHLIVPRKEEPIV